MGESGAEGEMRHVCGNLLVEERLSNGPKLPKKGWQHRPSLASSAFKRPATLMSSGRRSLLVSVLPDGKSVDDAVEPPRKSPRISLGTLHEENAAPPTPSSSRKAPASAKKSAKRSSFRAPLNRFGFKKRALQAASAEAETSSPELAAPIDLATLFVETMGDLDEAYAVLKEKQKAPQFEFKAKIDMLQGQVKTLKETLADLIKRARKCPDILAPLQEEVNGRLHKLADEASVQRGLADRANDELASVRQRSEERAQRIAEMQKKADAAKQQIGTLESARATECERADTAEAELDTRTTELAASRQECEEACEAAVSTAEAAEAAAAEASAEHTRLNERLEEEETRYETLSSEASATQEELTSARDGETARADTAEKSLAAASSELEALKETHAALVKDHAATSEAAAGTRARLESTTQQLEEKSATLTQKDADLRESIQSVLKMQSDHQEALSHERQRAATFEEEARQLRTRVQEAESAREKTDAELERSKAEAEGVRSELASTQSALETSNSERERLAIETAEQKDALQAKSTACDQLTGQLAEATEQLASEKASSSENAGKVEELSRKKHEIEVEYRSYKEHHSSTNVEQMSAISDLKLTVDRLSDQVQKKTVESTQAQGSLAQQSADLSSLQSKLMEQEAMRRALHNTIQELKGNIRVFCRVRPGSADQGRAIESNSDSKLALTHNETEHAFGFDRVFGSGSSQEDIFSEVDGLVQSSLDGYKVCIFAYGQTGSGKTFTMQGGTEPSTWGLIPRALSKILSLSESMRGEGWSWTLSASFLEIYNEALRDLLHDPKAGAPPSYAIKHDEAWGTVVANMSKVDVSSMEQINALMHRAAKQRAVGCTDMNSQSSRSHSVFALYLKGTNEKLSTELNGALHLVDLAGSERLDKSGAVGAALKETQAINKSLSSLADVFAAKAAHNNHVPFRNSKLTHLMEPCLSGHGKTLMMVNVAPEQSNAHESLCSLRFAKQVNQCDTGAAGKGGGPPKRNVVKTGAPPGKRPATAAPGASAPKRK